MDVLCFGEPLVGFYPPLGTSLDQDVPIVKTWGGDTSNTALGIARLGGRSAYLTKVGSDPFGAGFLHLWRENGVDTTQVIVDAERNTGLYFVSFEGNRHNLTYYRKHSAAASITEGDINPESVRQFNAVHLSGISIGMSESAAAAGKKLRNLARNGGKKVSFDINYRAPQWKSAEEAGESLKDFIRGGVDILEITDDEMEKLGWGKEPSELLDLFPEVELIALKQGPRGATILTRSEIFSVGACPVEVQDTVGAGDSFDAGFLFSILQGSSLREAAVFASAAAAHTCTGTGPLERMPTREQVVALIGDTGYEG